MIKKFINIYYAPDRQRLVRFNMLKKQLCPICGYIIYFNNKENSYMCRNEDCNFKQIKEIETKNLHNESNNKTF